MSDTPTPSPGLSGRGAIPAPSSARMTACRVVPDCERDQDAPRLVVGTHIAIRMNDDGRHRLGHRQSDRRSIHRHARQGVANRVPHTGNSSRARRHIKIERTLAIA
jgi:hypothetical protein